MKPLIHLNSITDINDFAQCTTNHPLLAVFDFSKANQYGEEEISLSADFYAIIFKNHCVSTIKYGRQSIDFREGSLVCVGPKQIITLGGELEKEKDEEHGWGLFFHPDLLYGTSLGNHIHNYTFFSYERSEALHLSAKEKLILEGIIQKIEMELQENIDQHSQTLLVSNIELLLNYCSRYYDRQFITRKSSNSRIVSELERLLKNYFKKEKNTELSIPSVKYLADHVHLSPSYLSDLLKRETGMNAQEHIHYHLIETAKNLLLSSDDSVGQIAYSLGFEYPQYFSRLFKQKTGLTPVEFRNHN
ncbi:MAG: helix-turn-helix transcriptional regulator [Bacteroidia bacterium]